jgi:hypothetical protein
MLEYARIFAYRTDMNLIGRDGQTDGRDGRTDAQTTLVEGMLKVRADAEELDKKVSHAMTRMQDFVDAVSHPQYFGKIPIIPVFRNI